MNPQLSNLHESDGILQFQLSEVDVSIANAIRRTILSDIPTVVFKTTPYDKNKCNIQVNTTRFNNEIIKQRLSCIPIHHLKTTDPLDNISLEVDVTNNTDSIIYVTTEDFRVKYKIAAGTSTGTSSEYLPKDTVLKIFPPNEVTNHFIDFVRLRPRIGDDLQHSGDSIQLTCDFSVGTAREDGAFNVVSTCSYGYTVDKDARDIVLSHKKQSWKDAGKSEEEIEFEEKNWLLLEGKRSVVKDSFDFILESVGVYDNKEIVYQACDILVHRLEDMRRDLETDKVIIRESPTTLKNGFDVIFSKDDFTLGQVVKFILYTKYFEGEEILSFCSYHKVHPHDLESILRLAYKDASSASREAIQANLLESIAVAKDVFTKIKIEFK